MPQYEYKVVPAPSKGLKARGVKGPEGRFANALEDVMNVMSADGWEYQRAETLPSQERSGLTGSVTTYRNVLVFRRSRAGDLTAFQPVVLETTTDDAPENTDSDQVSSTAQETTQDSQVADGAQIEGDPDRPAGQPGAVQMLKDNGVEEPSDVAGMTQALKERASHKTSD